MPVVRQMPWTFKDQHDKSIIAMSFNPTAQWLMILAADATVVLIPIYFLMCKKNLGDFEEKAAPIVVKYAFFCAIFYLFLLVLPNLFFLKPQLIEFYSEKERFERLSSLISSPSSWLYVSIIIYILSLFIY